MINFVEGIRHVTAHWAKMFEPFFANQKEGQKYVPPSAPTSTPATATTNVAHTSLHVGYIYNSTIATSGKINYDNYGDKTGNSSTYSLYHRHNARTAYTNFSTISNNKISGDNLPDVGATILATIYYREGQ